jgi:hypothetical protein
MDIVKLILAGRVQWNPMPPNNSSLWKTCIEGLRLQDLDSVIFQVVVDLALMDSVVFYSRLRNRFLVVGIETQNLENEYLGVKAYRAQRLPAQK